MSPDVDLRELAVDRSETHGATVRPRRQLLTRYVLPVVLICGFVSLVAWASRDFVFPPKSVTVVPVLLHNRYEVQAGRHAAVPGGGLD